MRKTPGALRLFKAEPVAEVVQALESLLERAKSGEIVSIAYAIEAREGLATNGWTLAKNIHCLKSGVMSLFARICLAGFDE